MSIRKKKVVSLKESLRLELHALRLEQDYELLTLSQAIKVDDKNQISKSLERLELIHSEIKSVIKASEKYK